MAVNLRESYDVSWDGTHNSAIMSIFVDSDADLAGLSHLGDVYFQLGSDALDVSTGDVYIVQTNGTWVKQPSKSPWSDVYTKSEVDALLQDIWDEIDGVNALVGSGVI